MFFILNLIILNLSNYVTSVLVWPTVNVFVYLRRIDVCGYQLTVVYLSISTRKTWRLEKQLDEEMLEMGTSGMGVSGYICFNYEFY